MLLNCGVGEDSWESLGLQGDPTSPSQRKSVVNILWKDWCWSWNSNTLAPWCEELTHMKRPWCWKILKAAGEGDDRGWDGCIASPTWRTRVWTSSGSWWWTGKPGVLQSRGRKELDMTEWLNWTELTGMGDECDCLMLSTFFSATLFGNSDKDWPFPVPWPLLGLPDLLTYWMQHLDGVILQGFE